MAQARPNAESQGNRGALAAVAMGCLVTLGVRGYQFGQSNHTIYLLEGISRASPELWQNDWFLRDTLQYHGVFSWIVAGLAILGEHWLRWAFLLGYLGLVVGLHVAWYALVRALSGDSRAYLLSVGVYYLMAGGLGLGFYEFLQDAAFLPSNVANVAMLGGIACWIWRRPASAGALIGLAGLFHLNHAVVALFLWAVMLIWDIKQRSPRISPVQLAIGSACVLALSAANLTPAAAAIWGKSGEMEPHEFVELYVKLRHPHHYDPSSWPWWLWVGFIVPLAGVITLSQRGEVGRRLKVVVFTFVAVTVVALAGAGLWYVSEPLVQMSLYRFTIFPKLIGCVGIALAMCRWKGFHYQAVGIGVAIIAVAAGRVGMRLASLPGDDPQYLAMCQWVEAHTDQGAVFVVPPDEQSFRLKARRAIVVNFKGVPQLSGELAQWRDRMQNVLGADLRTLPHEFRKALHRIEEIYDARPGEELARVARKYGAEYVVSRTALDDCGEAVVVIGRYRLYRVPGGV